MTDKNDLYKIYDILKETYEQIENVPEFYNNNIEEKVTDIYNKIDDFIIDIKKLIKNEVYNQSNIYC